MGMVKLAAADGSILWLVQHVRSQQSLILLFALQPESVPGLPIVWNQLKDQGHSKQEIVS